MMILAIIVAIALAFLVFRFVAGLVKFALLAIIIIVAWKILKGIIGLLIGVALAGLVVYGGMKLIEGPRNG